MTAADFHAARERLGGIVPRMGPLTTPGPRQRRAAAR